MQQEYDASKKALDHLHAENCKSLLQKTVNATIDRLKKELGTHKYSEYEKMVIITVSFLFKKIQILILH